MEILASRSGALDGGGRGPGEGGGVGWVDSVRGCLAAAFALGLWCLFSGTAARGDVR